VWWRQKRSVLPVFVWDRGGALFYFSRTLCDFLLVHTTLGRFHLSTTEIIYSLHTDEQQQNVMIYENHLLAS
jgi:hypothetical protein